MALLAEYLSFLFFQKEKLQQTFFFFQEKQI